MARKNDSPQKVAMREMMRDYLKKNDICIKNGTEVNSVMHDMMSVLLGMSVTVVIGIFVALIRRSVLISKKCKQYSKG